MSAAVEYLLNQASVMEIAEHLSCCDADFVPPLSARIDIKTYANKIVSKAIRFEAWADGTLAGLMAAYFNDQENRIAYITNVSVLRAWMGKGIATCLMSQCVEYAKASSMRGISLEVASDNVSAIRLYERSKFLVDKADESFVIMNLYLESGEENER